MPGKHNLRLWSGGQITCSRHNSQPVRTHRCLCFTPPSCGCLTRDFPEHNGDFPIQYTAASVQKLSGCCCSGPVVLDQKRSWELWAELCNSALRGYTYQDWKDGNTETRQLFVLDHSIEYMLCESYFQSFFGGFNDWQHLQKRLLRSK